eukprot:scpid103696/ scgid24605/ 
MEYCCLVWMGAPLARLDAVQRRALKLIGPGVSVPSLEHRRRVAALSFLYKLCFLPPTSPLKAIMPKPLQLADETPNTRLSAQRRQSHDFPLACSLPRRSRSTMAKAFPACVLSAWNSLPRRILAQQPYKDGMLQFKKLVHHHLLTNNWMQATYAL